MAVVYAARHPERVAKLVLLGGYAQGWKRRGDPAGGAHPPGRVEMIRVGWGRDNPAVRQMFTSLYMPDAPRREPALVLRSAAPDRLRRERRGNARGPRRRRRRDLLSRVKAPTLVLHARHDAGVPFEQGQELAAGIPGARFAVLDTTNHVLPATDPAWSRCARLIQEFLAE